MYNRRILISEDERSRILGLHENRKIKEWGFLNEEAVTNKVVEKFGSVEACKKQVNAPATVAQQLGLNWSTTQKSWLDAKCNGKTPCDKSGPSNVNLATALCEGTFGSTSSGRSSTSRNIFSNRNNFLY